MKNLSGFNFNLFSSVLFSQLYANVSHGCLLLVWLRAFSTSVHHSPCWTTFLWLATWHFLHTCINHSTKPQSLTDCRTLSNNPRWFLWLCYLSWVRMIKWCICRCTFVVCYVRLRWSLWENKEDVLVGAVCLACLVKQLLTAQTLLWTHTHKHTPKSISRPISSSRHIATDVLF